MTNDERPICYDNTMLSQFASCQRKFKLFWMGLEPVERAVYFTFGQIWQEALEKWYVSKGDTAYRLGEAIELAERRWADEGSPTVGRHTIENLRFMLTMYAIEYDKEPFEVIMRQTESGPKMELGFEFPLPGTPWMLGGAIDGYIHWGAYGKLVLENKTSGIALSDGYMAGWRHSSQVSQYYWGLCQLLPEAPFGVLMNCAFKGVSDKAKLAFKKDLVIPEGVFARDLEKRSPWRMKEFERDCRLAIEDIQKAFDRDHWPKTKDHVQCIGGIGKSPCTFRRLCLMEEEPWKMEVAQLLGPDLKFREKAWKPWERGGKRDESKDS